MLQYIADEEPVTKKRLISHARQSKKDSNETPPRRGSRSRRKPQIGEYRLLDTHILAPLEDREYIEIDDVGRSKEVTITNGGRNTLRVFDYLLHDLE